MQNIWKVYQVLNLNSFAYLTDWSFCIPVYLWQVSYIVTQYAVVSFLLVVACMWDLPSSVPHFKIEMGVLRMLQHLACSSLQHLASLDLIVDKVDLTEHAIHFRLQKQQVLSASLKTSHSWFEHEQLFWLYWFGLNSLLVLMAIPFTHCFFNWGFTVSVNYLEITAWITAWK